MRRLKQSEPYHYPFEVGTWDHIAVTWGFTGVHILIAGAFHSDPACRNLRRDLEVNA